MIPLPQLILVSALMLAALPAGAAPPAEPWRAYAIIVGLNRSAVPGVPPLRFADDDAARYYEILRGSAQQNVLLSSLDSSSQQLYPEAARVAKPPSRANLLAALREIRQRIAADRRRGTRTELYFIYSGHGHVDTEGQGFVSLLDGRFTRDDLYREVVEGGGATHIHLIIDACNAEHFVGARGPGGTWRPDRGGTHLDERFKQFLGRKRWQDYRNLGVLLSTSTAGETHEWSRLQAGVFSHEVRSGLLGAADANADGRITYAEMRAFLAATNRNVSHARARLHSVVFEPELGRSAPLWVWPSAGRYRLALELGDSGRLTIEDSRGLPYADLHKESGSRMRIVLLATAGQSFWVRRGQELAPLRIPVAFADLLLSTLQFKLDEASGKGSMDDALRAGLFAIPFGEQFYAGFVAAVPPDPLPVLDDQPGAAPSPAPRSSRWRKAGWAALGLASASALSAIVLAGLAARDAGAVSDRAATAVILTPEDRDLEARFRRERTAAWALGGVGVAAGVTAIVLLLTTRPRPESSVRVSASTAGLGAGLSLSARWR